jgi:hemolysin activation/secretion protein
MKTRRKRVSPSRPFLNANMSKADYKKNPVNPVLIPLFSALVLVAPATYAAGPQVPNYGISDAVKGANAPDLPPRPKTPPAPVIIQQQEAPMSMAAGEKIAIRDFHIEGADFLDSQALSPLLAPYRNRELTIDEINEAANKVTVFCRDKGYLVARAYVPKQEVKDGVLVIRVIAGQYGSFKMKNNTRIRDSLLQRVFDSTKENSAVVTRDSIERSMLLVADMPGAGVPVVSIAPGVTPGTSDFTAEIPAGERIKGYVAADNYGSRFTGKYRLSAGIDVNDLLGIADRLSLTALSTDASGLLNGRAAYSFALAPNGLRAEVAASRTTYKLGDEFADLDATGNANIVETTLAYPIKRSRDDTIYISLNVATKQLKDDVGVAASSTSRRDNVATLNLQRETYGSLFGFDSYANLSGGLSFGRLGFDDPEQKAENQAGADTVGDFSKVNLSFTGSLAFNSKWSLTGKLQAQQSLNRNLDGIEQLSLSGPGGILSYPDGVTGDNGYLLGAELKYALASMADFDHSVSVFTDYGAVRPEDDSFTTVGKVAISDVGVSYSVSNKRFFGRAQLAETLGGQQATSIYNHALTLQAQVGIRF